MIVDIIDKAYKVDTMQEDIAKNNGYKIKFTGTPDEYCTDFCEGSGWYLKNADFVGRNDAFFKVFGEDISLNRYLSIKFPDIAKHFEGGTFPWHPDFESFKRTLKYLLHMEDTIVKSHKQKEEKEKAELEEPMFDYPHDTSSAIKELDYSFIKEHIYKFHFSNKPTKRIVL